MWERHAALTLPGIVLLVMCLIMIGVMFVGCHYSRAAGFFTMATFGASLLALVALRRVWLIPLEQATYHWPVQGLRQNTA